MRVSFFGLAVVVFAAVGATGVLAQERVSVGTGGFYRLATDSFDVFRRR
jgi:hypothetical protein